MKRRRRIRLQQDMVPVTENYQIPKSLASDSEVLNAATHLFQIRSELLRSDGEESRRLAEKERSIQHRLHQAIDLSSLRIYLVRSFRQNQLNCLEREVLLLLTTITLGLLKTHQYSRGPIHVGEIQELLGMTATDRLQILQLLTPPSNLEEKGLVKLVEDDDGEPVDVEVYIARPFVEPLISASNENRPKSRIKTYQDLLDRLRHIVHHLAARSESIGNQQSRIRFNDSPDCYASRIRRQMRTFSDATDENPDWPMSKFLAEYSLSGEELLVFLLLLGKSLGYLRADNDVFSGEGLAMAVSTDLVDVRKRIDLLRGEALLRKNEIIQVCGGLGSDPAMEDDSTLLTCEFEVTPKTLERLEISPQQKRDIQCRTPLLKMDSLVLSERVMNPLQMALTQARNSERLMKDWGLGKIIPYGNAVTLLFSGPPGVGKTASAEAIAAELSCPILVADYSRIQNCWVGQTEKNIVRIFRTASESNAVLFWDEADAMFYDRDSANRNWEVRDVNVLLQELERFTGVCILATNRRISLDKALERRITLKIEFTQPSRIERYEIWKRLIPLEMPLAGDVDFGTLSEASLTGGEIKNAIINAARSALHRNPDGQIEMKDFLKALSLESEKPSREIETIGFC